MNLETVVEYTIENNKDKVQEYIENNSSQPLNYLVGIVLQETNGNYHADEIEKELKHQLENPNTTVGYPRQLTIHHRTNESSIAEQFANKLRNELDVPLESVYVPERFNVDEIKIKYDIHEDGTVEFVNALK